MDSDRDGIEDAGASAQPATAVPDGTHHGPFPSRSHSHSMSSSDEGAWMKAAHMDPNLPEGRLGE
jgi:hypothetical protein